MRSPCLLLVICLWAQAISCFQSPSLPSSRSSSTTSTTRLLGIKGFRTWFESQFPNAIHSIPRTTGHDEFDHVLIDMNQLLHVCLRRSRSEGHALTLLMKELDDCCRLATPTQSLVLAMDGPPSASKLATQRQRRLSNIVRTERKLAQMDSIAKTATGKRVFSKTKRDRKKWRLQADTRTLRITPGTDFMVRTEQAILYWAWQRLQNSNPHHFLKKVKVYISPSTVPGEGEVKLLEWILRQSQQQSAATTTTTTLLPRIQPGESIAIMGGDSDLVLEGLVIPPSVTHNVFVLLPDGNTKYLSVSLWETTRALAQFLPPTVLSSTRFLRLRTDLALLLILNGNDYLPKLRGSSGFHKVFHAYLRTLREWLTAAAAEDHPVHGDGHQHQQQQHYHLPFLVEPESLTFNVPFCLAFFRRLEKMAPPELLWNDQRRNSTTSTTAASNSNSAAGQDTPLSRFHGLVDAGFFPKPIRWRVGGGSKSKSRRGDDDDDDEESNDVVDQSSDDEDDNDDEDSDESYYGDDDDDEEDDGSDMDMDEDDDDDDDEDDDEDDENGTEENDKNSNQKKRLVALRIGKAGTEDFVYYETWVLVQTTPKKAKQKLATMALEDIFGDLDNYYENIDNRDTSNTSYPWEIVQAAEGKPEAYLGGLLWNLQTYQDGVCPDYAFNYGKRMSPTAGELVRFFKQAQDDNITLGLHHLMANVTSPRKADAYPISAGVSCLAALPSQVRDLVPEPYRQLDMDLVEQFYGACMDPTDNVFDVKKFERLCDDAVAELKLERKTKASLHEAANEEEKMDLNHYWFTLSKGRTALPNPVQPPPPFSERLSELRPDSRIRVNKVKAVWQPRQRLVWEEHAGDHKRPGGDELQEERLNLARPDPFLARFNSLEEVSYKKAYQKDRKTTRKKITAPTFEMSARDDFAVTTLDKRKKKRKPISDPERMQTYDYTPPPKQYATTTDGQSALACLKQLQDLGFIGELEWTSTMPSPSAYASFNPEEHELVSLKLRKGRLEENILDNPLVYEQDRHINHVSRQALKQHLGTFALCEIVGPGKKWTTMSFKDLRQHVAAKHNVTA